ncbi:MAG TPA: hypothetical protein VFN10_08415 [Thermoanaerobaculia bacterium]|nr:hypothetical protein [Thermoanaerobaculia bacterium]
MAEEIFRVQSRRAARMKRVQTAQHAVGAFLLIWTAVEHLTGAHSKNAVLPIFEIVAGVVLIAAIVRERLSHHHSRVGWVELAGSAMLFVEAVAKLEQRHHMLFYFLSFIPPFMLLIFAVFDEKLRNGIYIKTTDDFLEMRLRALFPRRVRWNEVRAYRIAPKHLELIGDGRVRRFKTTDIVDLPAAVQWVEEQLRRRGITAAS